MSTDTLDISETEQNLVMTVVKLKQALQEIAVACKTEHWSKHDIRRLAETALRTINHDARMMV